MSPDLKSNLILSGISAVVITAVFYLWSKRDPERPTVRTHAKVLVTSFGVNFCLLYALNKKMVPGSLSGGGNISAPWGGNSEVVSKTQVVKLAQSPTQANPVSSPNPAKFTAIDLNEPTF
tara:strand:- start:215 stop:574 length:360 start_codon:yes stop_codon:yes gene_type:complete